MFARLRKIMKSRPESESLVLAALSNEELELISSFLWVTRLDNGISKHRDAALSLIIKIEKLKGDDFAEFAAQAVDFTVDVIDYNGNVVQSVSYSQLEFDV